MSEETTPAAEAHPYLQRRRRRLKTAGARRLEVAVPAADAGLVKAIARALLKGGGEAQALRSRLGALVDSAPARTGGELLAFFRASPLLGADLEADRDAPDRDVRAGPPSGPS